MHLTNFGDELIQSSLPVQYAPCVCRLRGNSKMVGYQRSLKTSCHSFSFTLFDVVWFLTLAMFFACFPQMYFVWYCKDLQRPSLNSGGCPIQAAGTLGLTSCRFNDIVYYQSILLSPLSSRHLKSWHSRKANFILGHWKYCRPTHIPFPFNALVSQWQQLIKKYRWLQK